jgi:predicted XRE-type DNA-binding protein
VDDANTRERLAQLISEGGFKTKAEAARQLGVSRSRVSYILHHELKERPTREKLLQLVSEGNVKSHEDAAKQLGVSRARVSYILARAGVRIPRESARVNLVCTECGKERRVRASYARKLRTGLCLTCWRASGPRGRRRTRTEDAGRPGPVNKRSRLRQGS